MSQSYVKECIFCKNEIKMSDEKGKWLPFNKDGTSHECQKKNGSNGHNGTQDLSLEVVLKKLQSIGITIDMEKLRNI
jgi:hypothetical protein